MQDAQIKTDENDQSPITDVAPKPTSSDKITCHIDGVEVHSVQVHIKKNHQDTWTTDRYIEEFPGKPLLSPFAEMIMEKKREAAKTTVVEPDTAPAIQANLSTGEGLKTDSAMFHEIFNLGEVPAAMSAHSGKPISISVMSGHDTEAMMYLPDVDDKYVFNIDLLKKVIIGFQLNLPVYLWGFHGTGKTTLLQQAAAHTKRPFIRVQHSLNMQESDVLGQWTVRDGSTIFQLGPLPTAMINGWTYCADEYDTAMPNVTTVYQPVLEGQSLLIKDAPSHFRKILPHPNFRFVATGNTNGCGDETGLYQGTMTQNAANYSRFGVTEQVEYMDEKLEVNIIRSKTGLTAPDAKKIVKFANQIRRSFEDGKISMTVSPRELITAAKLGTAYGGKWDIGLGLAFANRLSSIDKQVSKELLQRIFGGTS